MPLFLLPLLSVTALEMPSQAEVEEALSDGLRAALAEGWELADVRGDDDELVFTMTKDDQIEQHVAHLDGSHNAYRVDRGAALPAHPWPAEHVALAIAGGGGIEIGSECGGLDVRTYRPGPRARTPAAAARLVGALLKAADDLETANLVDGSHAVFGLSLESGYAELHVTLAADTRVVGAELRHYSHGPDHSTFTARRSLGRAVGKAVTHISATDDGPLVLVGAKRFTLGYDHFESTRSEDDGETCGC